MVNTNYVNDGTIGIDVTATSTTEDFTLGDRHTGNDGSVWVYCQADGAITGDGYVVLLDEAFQADLIDTSNSDGAFGQPVGVARVAFADNEYGWIQVAGTGNVRVKANAAVNTALNTSGTDGVLDDDAAVGTEVVDGIIITTAAGGGESTVEGILNFPTVGATL